MFKLAILIGLIYVIYRLSSGLSLFGGDTNNGGERIKVTPYDIELNILSLTSLVIKSDGYVNRPEMDFVRAYFVQKYGKARANATFKTFNETLKNREITAHRVCYFILHKTNYQERIEIIQLLFGVALADGNVSPREAYKIEEIAGFLKIYRVDFETIKRMYSAKSNTYQKPVPPNAYKVLDLETNATDAEVKTAYRNLVKKYHPDKVITGSDTVKKNAEMNFRRVQEAYEQIQKERGF
ncbi:molecular chaperone DjiA [Neptunitalea lumnitzerae]|uniref:Molecular chaperone DjlA n=1 Tax=Neptunitalea lumnitzerae TaxID=2965509 RepID=A0ABQ5MFQ2_9FLAO|nr:molecular chaperone DjiA [Neptunitalea sp. Y10]GLB48259.1 molecular chaperone DjlA [Neptunitalea sp. Y10]